jgi:hypothetical protein
MSAFELPPGGRVRAVGTVGPQGLLVAVGIAPQPWRPRAVVEATVETVGSEGSVRVLGSAVRVAGHAVVSGVGGEVLTPAAIGAGARVWVGGSWSEDEGFVADEIRLRAPREFEIVKVAGPARALDTAGGRIQIAGFTVVLNERTLLGTGEEGVAEDEGEGARDEVRRT